MLLIPLLETEPKTTYHPSPEDLSDWPQYFKLGIMGIICLLFDSGATINTTGFDLTSVKPEVRKFLEGAHGYLKTMCHGGQEAISKLAENYKNGKIDSYGRQKLYIVN